VIRELLQSITGYPALLLACIGSGIVVPLPEDFPLLYAGVRIANGEWSLGAVLAITLTGVGVRDLLAYGAGRTLGHRVLSRPGVLRFLGARRMERAARLVRRRGAVAILAGRFLVGFRAPVFIAAGTAGMPLRSFLLYDGLGLLVAVPLMVGLGVVFGEPLAEGFFWGLQRARLVMATALAGAILVGLWRWSVGPRERTGEE